jgi:hypothetical protein
MSAPEKYVLDANVFIQAHQRFYSFDICPGYWNALLHHHSENRICSVDKVRDELAAGGDILWDWARETFGTDAFHDSAVAAQEFGGMASWVMAHPHYRPAAQSKFMSTADGWLAAFAKVQGQILVTLEESAAADTKKRVPLVNLCEAFGVQTITPYEMLRRLGVRMTWAP